MRLIDDADVAPVGADADKRRRAIHLHHLQREAGEAEDLHALALGGDEPAARHRDAADAPQRAQSDSTRYLRSEASDPCALI